MPVEVEHDGTFTSLEPYLKNKVGQDHQGPVVWNCMELRTGCKQPRFSG